MDRDLQTSEDLDKYRQLLRLTALCDLDPILQAKLDLSGIVQQTLWDAHRGLADFCGTGEAELLAWMRKILANNVIDAIRNIRRAKYDAALEVSLAETSVRLDAILEADHTPPEERAIRNEQLLLLTQAIAQLPEDQQTAIVRHHLQGAKLAEVAQEMGRSKDATAGLIHRGMTRLKEMMTGHRPT